MNQLTNFNYGTTTIRTITKDGEPWFVLKDVCDVLEISNPSDTKSRLDEDEYTEVNLNTLGLTKGTVGNPNVTIISESGLYRVVMRSDKPQAKPFQKWVTSEVLPSIRKNGLYAKEELLDNPDMLLEIVTRLTVERKARLLAEQHAKAMQIKVDESDMYWTVIKYNKIYKKNWTFKETQRVGKMLSAYCRKHGVLVEKSPVEGSQSGGVNSYPKEVWKKLINQIDAKLSVL
jgi:prophage antirepressor-like protein